MSSLESSSNSNIIEVDGILFETLMPVQTIHFPQLGETISVQFGVRITNQTLTPYRFNLPGFLPELIDSTGQLLYRNYASNSRWRVQETDIPLLQLDESLTFFLWNANLNWRTNQCLHLSGYANYGAVWQFGDLEPGSYRIRLEYKGFPQSVELLMQKGGHQRVDNFWAGKVATAFVEFNLVQP